MGRDETPDPPAIRHEGFSGQAQVACAWCGFYTPAGPSCELCGSPLLSTHVAFASDTSSTEIVPDARDTVEDPPPEVTEEEPAVPTPEAALEEPEAAMDEPEAAMDEPEAGLEEPVAHPKPDRSEVESFVQRFHQWKQLRDRMTAGLPQEPPADPVPAEEAVVEEPVVTAPPPAPEPVAPAEPGAALPIAEPMPVAGPWGAPPPWSAALLPPRWHRPEPPPEPPPVGTRSPAPSAEDPAWDPFTPPTAMDLPASVDIDNRQVEPASAEGSRRPSGWKRLWRRREQEPVPQIPLRPEAHLPVAAPLAPPAPPAAAERIDPSERPSSSDVVERRAAAPKAPERIEAAPASPSPRPTPARRPEPRDGVPCSRCGEPSERGLCEVCREALNELQGLIWGESES